MQSIPKLNLLEIKEYLKDFALPFGQKQENVVMLWGEPGLGKSMIIKQIAKEIDADVIEYFASTANETEVVGVPIHDEKEDCIRFRPLENMKFHKTKKTIWFLDEINRGRPEVIQALFSILSSYPRKIGVNEVPDNVCIVLAGNLGEEDGTIVTDFNDASFFSKIAHIEVDFDKDIWLDYIRDKYIASNSPQKAFATNVVNFLKDKDVTWFKKIPENPSSQKAYPVPRTLEKLINVFGGKTLTPITVKWGASIVGNMWMQTFANFIKDLDLGKKKVSPSAFFDKNVDIKELNSAIKGMSNKDMINFGKEMQSYLQTIKTKTIKDNLNLNNWTSLCDLIKAMPQDTRKSVWTSIIDDDNIRNVLDEKGDEDKDFAEVTKDTIKDIVSLIS
jgi:hypothetical protein